MKNIGIITFQNANNYGAVYQTFALKKTVEKLSCNVSVVNYDSPTMGLKSIQRNEFKEFVEGNLNLTKEYRSKQEIDVADFDAIISGSDQVWNPRLTGGDMTYFLDFVPDNVKKVSYAASIGLNGDLFIEHKDVFEKYVPAFSGISLREETHVEYIQSIAKDKEVIASIDPSLLLTSKEYLDAFELPDNRSEDYIFVFSYALDPKMYDFANMLSLKSGYKIVALSPYNAGSYVSGTKVVKNVPPVEWLELFNKAKLIITDSFHGMMFSIVFNKPFYAYTPNRSNVARVKDILKKLNLEDRKLTNITNINDTVWEMDYTKVNEILEKERKKSLEYLKKHLL